MLGEMRAECAVVALVLAVPLSALGAACMGGPRAPENGGRPDASPVASRTSNGIVDTRTDAVMAPAASADTDARAESGRCDSAAADAGVLDVYVWIEPIPRGSDYGPTTALFVVIPLMKVHERWTTLMGSTCASGKAEPGPKLVTGCSTFETMSTLTLWVDDGWLVSSYTSKNYDGLSKERTIAPIPLPCGAKVVLHGL